MKWIILAFILGIYGDKPPIKLHNGFSKQFESKEACDSYIMKKNIMLTTGLHDYLSTVKSNVQWDVKGYICIPKSVYDSLPNDLEEEPKLEEQWI